ncbi:MAG: ATP-binding cassette domain-containing protein [Candidatus Bathyarchaeota archaeon]|nr:ATP-binding cassette domain-containing protein [Candidatus Bathyarchaeota archaeon]MDH5495165.1 ATP-binding cassette domain-containing protein [Candidatus Bathyarchaeota archaeon]
MSIIRTIDLTKRFEDLVAVDHLNLNIEDGEIFGLLGPNGAGKTTTVLMLTTVIKPTKGTAIVGEHDIRKSPDDVRKLIGICFQEPKLLWVSTPWDVLNWHAKVCGLSTQERKKRVKQVLEDVSMWDYRKKKVHGLSGGMRKRVEVAKILIQRPKVAFIDEPTAQIDVVGKHKIWNMIRELRDEGSTIILATNELYEADILSDRVGIMHKGKLLVCDTPKTLKDSIPGGDIVEIQLEKEAPKNALEELKKFPEVVDVATVSPKNLRIYLNKVQEVVPQIMKLFLKNNLPIMSINMSEPSLDDVFVHYTGLTIEEAEQKGSSR